MILFITFIEFTEVFLAVFTTMLHTKEFFIVSFMTYITGYVEQAQLLIHSQISSEQSPLIVL